MESIKPNELIRRIEAGERMFVHIEIPEDESLEACILSSCQFFNCLISYIDFSKARLNNSVFKDCNLKGSKFDGVDLSNALIENCAVEAITFKDAQLTDFKFQENYYYGLTLNQDDLNEDFGVIPNKP